jgi:hypothetical protein
MNKESISQEICGINEANTLQQCQGYKQIETTYNLNHIDIYVCAGNDSNNPEWFKHKIICENCKYNIFGITQIYITRHHSNIKDLEGDIESLLRESEIDTDTAYQLISKRVAKRNYHRDGGTTADDIPAITVICYDLIINSFELIKFSIHNFLFASRWALPRKLKATLTIIEEFASNYIRANQANQDGRRLFFVVSLKSIDHFPSRLLRSLVQAASRLVSINSDSARTHPIVIGGVNARDIASFKVLYRPSKYILYNKIIELENNSLGGKLNSRYTVSEAKRRIQKSLIKQKGKTK